MPEAPDLEIIKEFLNERVAGQTIEYAKEVRPTVLRSLAGEFPEDIRGRTIDSFRRQGKFLMIELSGDRLLAVNPMLTGALQYCDAKERVRKATYVILGLANGRELRYIDDRQMGKIYYATLDQLSQIPRLLEQGPDVLDGITLEEFQARLKRFHGEIKGVLTRGAFIAGIGNAYSDEILFAASISPFKKSRSLSSEELHRLYQQSRAVVLEAMEVLRARVGEEIHVRIRDFLKVHRKGGQPCPGCGGTISEITPNQRVTSYCRRCQPGMLIRN